MPGSSLTATSQVLKQGPASPVDNRRRSSEAAFTPPARAAHTAHPTRAHDARRLALDGRRPLTRRTGHGHTPRGREYSQVSSPPPTPTHVQIDSQSLLPPPLQQRHRATRLRVRVGRRGMAGTAHREAAPLLLAVSGAAPPLERLVCAPRVGVGRRLAAARAADVAIPGARASGLSPTPAVAPRREAKVLPTVAVCELARHALGRVARLQTGRFLEGS